MMPRRATPSRRGGVLASEASWESLYRLVDGCSYSDPRLAHDAPTRRLAQLLAAWVPERSSVLELGCGASKWLPFLALERLSLASGVDFSASGLELGRAIMADAGVPDYNYICQDIDGFVQSATQSHRTWEVVCSFGLVEHFGDLRTILRQHTVLVADGGRLIITFPRLYGINGVWARGACPKMMTWHQPVDPADVVSVLENEGFRILASHGLGGVRLFGTPDQGPLYLPARVIRKVVNGIGEVADRIGNQYLSPVGQPFMAIVACRDSGAGERR